MLSLAFTATVPVVVERYFDSQTPTSAPAAIPSPIAPPADSPPSPMQAETDSQIPDPESPVGVDVEGVNPPEIAGTDEISVPEPPETVEVGSPEEDDRNPHQDSFWDKMNK